MDNFSIGYSVDDSQLVKKIGEDAQIVKQLDKAVASASNTMKGFDKSQDETIRTVVGAKKELGKLKKTIADLTITYNSLSKAEKESAIGKGISQKLAELKTKAAEFSDAISDANEEISHLASDTRITDGLNLMTTTVGNVASAMVALGGDGEHLKEVLADIAKIQTTIKAVEALTKAFQAQNRVLLKNPYVLAATAIAALGMAIYEYTTKLSASAKEEQKAIERQKKYRESLKVTNKHIGSLIGNYYKLQAQYKGLNAESEKAKWIKSHKTDFENLGIAVNKVKDADNAFINNTSNFISAIKKRAQAMAAEEKLQAAYEERLNVSENFKKAGDKISLDFAKKLFGEGMFDVANNGRVRGNTVTLNSQGARKYNANLDSLAKQDYEKTAAKLGKIIGENAAVEIANSSNGNGNKTTSISGAFKMKDMVGMDFSDYYMLSGFSKQEKELEDKIQGAIEKFGEESWVVESLRKQLDKLKDSMLGVTKFQDEMTKTIKKNVEEQKEQDKQTKEYYEGMAENVSAYDAVMELSNAFNTLGSAIEGTGGKVLSFTGNVIASGAEMIQQLVTIITANEAAALAKGISSASGLMFPYNLAAIATVVGTIASMFATLPKFAEGGIVGGTTIGDMNLARVNGGEMILNGHQQESLFNIINGGSKPTSTLNGKVEFDIKGQKLKGVLNNYNRKKSKV